MNRLLPLLLACSLLLPLLTRAEIPEASRKIDAILAASWKEKGIEPVPLVDDETFARRIYLDAIGRIPTGEELRSFLSDSSPDRRSRLIDSLLESEGYVNHMFSYWADILRIHNQQGGGQNIVPAYVRYVRGSLRDNKPYDEFVRELVTAEGETYGNGAIGYYYRDRGMPLDNMANTIRIFLGTRLECAQCHNHPFDKWSQMDFYQMAAFSYGMEVRNQQGGKLQELQRAMNQDKSLKGDEKRAIQRAIQEIRRPVRNTPVVNYQANKLPKLPHDYQYEDAEPKAEITERVMFGDEPEIASPGERLHVYADWMTSPENPRFTKVIANRMWKKAMGMGLVEPIDEFTDSTAAAIPELFVFLEEEMKRQDYDLREFLRILYHTEVYQRQSSHEAVAVPADYAFTGPRMRRLSAEQIWDSVVTLINPNPELGNWRRDQENRLRAVSAEIMTRALEEKDPEKLKQDIQVIAKTQKRLQNRLVALQKEQNEARKNKDQKKIRALSNEANQLRRQLAQAVFERVYAPELKRGSLERVSLEMPEGMPAFAMKIDPSKLDQNGRIKQDLVRELAAKEEEMIEREMDRLKITDEKERRSYLSFRKSVSGNYSRAAHLTSPAPDGHFLRQFGQSDRETIENAESSASVTQALTLLNGPVLRSVANPQSALSRDVLGAETPEEQIERIFQGILSRSPSEDELAILSAEGVERGDKFLTDIAFALINTEEFFFLR